MMQSLRIKVKTTELITAIEKRKQELVAAHEKALANFPSALATYQRNAVKVLEHAISEINKGNLVTFNNYDRRCLRMPERPSTPTLDTSAYDRSIATLRMSAQDTITISADDYARYVH